MSSATSSSVAEEIVAVEANVNDMIEIVIETLHSVSHLHGMLASIRRRK